jgi:hypothetical protein
MSQEAQELLDSIAPIQINRIVFQVLHKTDLVMQEAMHGSGTISTSIGGL